MLNKKLEEDIEELKFDMMRLLQKILEIDTKLNPVDFIKEEE